MLLRHRAPWLPLVFLVCAPVAAQEPPASRPTTATEDAPLLLRERKVGVMGTDLQIEVLGSDAEALERSLDAAIAEIRRVEDVFTTWRASPFNALNDAAGKGPQPTTPEIARLVQRSLEVGRLTGGAFDITYAGAGRLWDYKKKPPTVPTPEQVASALERIDYRRIEVDLDAKTVTIPAGMRINLGGIAKGYGVDRAMAVLMKRGIKHALVNAGGDLKALGRKHGKVWEIAIKHPRERERVIAVLPVSNTCVVTSGDYERFFEHEGRRYHHIIDPRTGYPSQGCMSATVVAPNAAFADALATALCVLDPEKGLALVERLDRIEALVVGMDGRVRMTSGLEKGAGRGRR